MGKEQTQDAKEDEDKTEDEDEETDPWFVIKPENSQRTILGDEEDEGEGTDPESEGDDVVDEDEDGEVVDEDEDVDEDGDRTADEDEDGDGNKWVKVSTKEQNEKGKGKVETKDSPLKDADEVSFPKNRSHKLNPHIRHVWLRTTQRYSVVTSNISIISHQPLLMCRSRK